MKKLPRKDIPYCTFCESTETLKEFKAVYVCDRCVEDAKALVVDKESK